MARTNLIDPNFKVGDEVEFELEPNLGQPRWDYDRDQGSSGEWFPGTVNFVGKNVLTISYNKKSWWNWPLQGSKRYSPDQWDRPGYLRLKGTFGKHLGKVRLIDKGGYFCTEEY